MEFFGIGGGELVLLLVMAVIMFGPEKLPEFSRKLARIVYGLRVLANQATDQIKEELGPEYADLSLADLHPKTFVRTRLLTDLDADLDEIKKELNDVKSDLGIAGTSINQATREVNAAVNDAAKILPKPSQTTVVESTGAAPTPAAAPSAPTVVGAIPFDAEAT